jgi:hypothetical protein
VSHRRLLAVARSIPTTPSRAVTTNRRPSTSLTSWRKESDPEAPSRAHLAVPFSESGGKFFEIRRAPSSSTSAVNASCFLVSSRIPCTSSPLSLPSGSFSIR